MFGLSEHLNPISKGIPLRDVEPPNFVKVQVEKVQWSIDVPKLSHARQRTLSSV